MNKSSKLSVLFITIVMLSQIFLSAGTAFGSSMTETGSVASESVTFSVYGYIKSGLNSSDIKINSDFAVEISDTNYSAKTNEDGYFEISNVSPMTNCKIKISKAGYLKREITDVTIKSDTIIGKKDAPVVMWAGDVNQDDSINMADVLAIAVSFGCIEGDERYNAKCDINLDGSINMGDVMIIAANFNRTAADYENIIVNPKFVSVACGFSHSVALRSDGTVWAFGSNYCGECGIGSNNLNDSPPYNDIPVKMKNLSQVKDVKCNSWYTVALTEKGEVWVCGASNDLSYVSKNNECILEPIKLDVSDVKAISPYSARLSILKNDGTVWEYDGYKYKDREVQKEPRQVIGLSNVKEIATGKFYSVALKEDGTVWTWGSYWNEALGHAYDKNIDLTIPRKIIELNDVKSIAVGLDYSVALLNNGKVMSWGLNGSGQLGNGTLESSYSPVEAIGLSNVNAIDAHAAQTLALTEDGKVWGWGSNGLGALGIGNRDGTSIPVEIKNLTNIKDIAAGFDHSLFLEEDGTMWGCGYNYYGQLGITPDKDSDNIFLYPVKVTSELVETISEG